jgi:hypothetical protein
LAASTDAKKIGTWNWPTANVGIATGHGLFVLDIDPRHDGLASMKQLQEQLGSLPAGPRVKTGGGGGHWYFREPEGQIRTTLDVPGIDLKGAGGYVVAPPSIHKSGAVYLWEVSPETVPLLKLPQAWLDYLRATDSPSQAAIPSIGVKCNTENADNTVTTDNTVNTGLPRNTHSNPPHPLSFARKTDSEDDLPNDVQEAILQTLPDCQGRRNRQLFDLARALKAIPRLTDAPLEALEPYVRAWHRLGIARNVIATEAFDESRIDFGRAWPKVKFPRGSGIMVSLLGRAIQHSQPRAAEKYELPGVRLLLCLCRELQRQSGEKPFYLGCRTAGQLLGVDHVTAWRWLWLLANRKDIEEVEKGDLRKRRASSYRYRGD